MPPKKSKAAAASARPISASQPEASRPTRTSGRKRRHSDASEVSDVASVDSKKPAKRSKRKATPEPEVIIEEDEQEEAMMDADDARIPHTIPRDSGEVVEESVEVTTQTTTKHVHFGSDTENVDPNQSTAAFITPHPRGKMTVKRRTLSPHIGGESKRVKESRTSLPAVLSQDGETDPVKIVSEWEFRPLQTVLNKRISELRESKTFKKSLSQQDDDVMAMDDMLVLDGHEEISYPQLPTPSSTPFMARRISAAAGTDASERSATKMRVGWDVERHRFHEAILQFQKEAERAKGDLQILTIEVQSLGFAEDESALDILKSIRESFDNVREFLETELPGTVPEDATNEDLVEILIANVKEFADRLRTADKELMEKGTLNADLGNQVNNLIDRLASREVRLEHEQEKVEGIRESKEGYVKEMVELQKMLDLAQVEKDDMKTELDEEIANSDKLEQEKADLETSLERLQESLQKYQAEETKLTELINKMEEEHRQTIQSMNAEREDTVRELEDRLDAEIEKRTEADKQLAERQVAITTTEEQLLEFERDLDALTKERDELQAELDEEVKSGDAIQEDLDTAQKTIADLETRISRVEEEAETMEEQLASLREQNQTERQQREGAEQALDDRDREVEELTNKLKEQGKEANELRLKAHDIQTKNQQRITELEQQLSDQDADFQTDMADEVKRREDAEGLAHQRATDIKELQQKLTEVEQSMRVLLVERDTRIEELEDEVEQKVGEITNLQDDLRTAENTHKTQIQQRDDRAADLEDKIADLEHTIATSETTITTLRKHAADAAELHDSQTEERNAAIADLNAQLAALEEEVEEHKQDKASLERRVESEAMQMLQVSNDFSEQIADLKQQLLDKQAAIAKVEKTSRDADQKATQLLAVREEEVETWKESVVEREEVITQLEGENEDVRRKFKAYVRKSMDTMDGLQRQLEEAKAAVDAEGDGLRAEGKDMLEELEKLSAPRHEVVAVNKQVKKVKGKKTKMVVDSGVGLGAEEEREERTMMME